MLFFPEDSVRAGFLYKKIEVVSEFKLLGIVIDNKLSFSGYIKQLRATVFSKLFAIQKIFYLPFNINISSMQITSYTLRAERVVQSLDRSYRGFSAVAVQCCILFFFHVSLKSILTSSLITSSRTLSTLPVHR